MERKHEVVSLVSDEHAPNPASASGADVSEAASARSDSERVLHAVDEAFTPRDVEMLRQIDESVVFTRGLAFFQALVRALAQALNTRYSFVARFDDVDRSVMHILSFWDSAERTHKDNYTFPVAGTPCTFVLKGEIVAIPRDVLEHYPAERRRGVQSYLAIPLIDRAGVVVGHLVAADTKPNDWADVDLRIIRLFAMRTAAEIIRRQYEEELEQARIAAEAANRAKSEFLATMSHELRTPLNGILGFAQLLHRDPALGPQQLESLGIIKTCGEHLLTLINDVLDLAKVEAGKLELQSVEFDLPELVRMVAELARLRASQSGVAFELAASGDLPRLVCGDARRLRQILINLLGNAVKFTPSGRVCLRVVHAPKADGAIRLFFEVTDTGIGIPADQLERIFEPFHQVCANGASVEGTGLGLSITRRLVALMGGEIQVVSAPGRGSAFSFELAFGPASTPVNPQPLVAGETRAMAAHLPRAHASRLIELCREGDILGVRVELDRLASGGECSVTTLAQLQELAQRYDLRAIRQLIESHLS
jgi:signal transduction histidine kinase